MDHAEFDAARLDVGDADRIAWQPADEIDCAVDRVDDPESFRLDTAAFLPEYVVTGECL